MAEVRIPVSLKFNDESDFYNDFVLDMRENKTLSGFIVDILEAYYSDEEVRDAVLKFMDENNPLILIKERLQNIQTEHAKTMMMTSTLSGHNTKIMEEVQGVQENPTSQASQSNPVDMLKLSGGTQQPVPPQQQGTSSNEVVSLLMQRIENLEHLLPSINDKLNQLLVNPNPYQNPNAFRVGAGEVHIQPQPQVQPQVVPPSVYSEPTEEMVNQNIAPTPIQTDIPAPIVTVESEIQQSPVQTIVSQETQVAPQVEAPVIMVVDESEATEEKPKEKKAASFGKALNSLKKK